MLIDLNYHPRSWQAECYRGRKRFGVVVVHRRGGKTVFGEKLLMDAALQCGKPRPRFGYLAPYRNQAKAIAWDYLKTDALMIPGATTNESELMADLPNGAQIRLFGADNADAMRGLYFDGIVIDEVADMKPEVWGSILRPALTDRNGWALFIGTPKGINLFSELYYAALKDSAWFSALYTVDTTGILSRAELDLAARTMTPAQYRQEFLCDFGAASDNQMIPFDLVLAASGKHLRDEVYQHAAKIIGVDVAFSHTGDRSVIFKRQGLAAFVPWVRTGVDNMELAAEVARQFDHWKADAIFVDAGRGEGVISRLQQLGYSPAPVNFGGTASSPHFSNKRSEMWAAIGEWLRAGGALPNIPELQADLCSPSYRRAPSTDKVIMESKDQLKERGLPSPDMGDALAATFAYPVAAKDDPMLPYLHASARPQIAVMEDNPLGLQGVGDVGFRYNPGR